VNHKSFVLAWLEAAKAGKGTQAVATKFNITKEKATSKANYLRKIGVNLPDMPRGVRYQASVEELNELIADRI
jgi:hypothetical protein